MNEQANEVEVVEPEAAAEQEPEVVEQALSDEEFDALWEDEETAFAEQAEAPEEDQPEEAQSEPTAETGETEEQAEAEDTDQYLELKHLDEVRKVSKEEAKVLAQKGMDYDRIRGKLADAEANNAKMARYEEFFNEVRGEMSIEDLITDTLARVRSDREGKDYETVKAELLADRQKAEQPQAPSQEDVLETMRKQSFSQFLEAYPGVKAAEIPQEVWDDMKITNNLVASYAKFEAKKLAEENAVLKQNAKNKARSTGSMKSYGSGSYEKSEFDRVFDSDDY